MVDNTASGGNQPRITVTTRGYFSVGVIEPLAKTHIDQASAGAAIPVPALDQADISDGFIKCGLESSFNGKELNYVAIGY